MRQITKSVRVLAAAAAIALATGVGGAATASAAEIESTPSVPNSQPQQRGGPDPLLMEEGLFLEEGPLLMTPFGGGMGGFGAVPFGGFGAMPFGGMFL
ncbi:hypothetical protein [Rhodococcus spongiicola]|uniref:Uncharacterized protein n=1 Tax=Rhodococcus spongiicola TaxID=2487352 RepID=A0A438AUK6_9NOCA|nr:hypothetical protein [Rhodococcus spongiicola]RVW02374.1 hypothetical protein EF834_12305 [Rhodococcus spongiicola]